MPLESTLDYRAKTQDCLNYHINTDHQTELQYETYNQYVQIGRILALHQANQSTAITM